MSDCYINDEAIEITDYGDKSPINSDLVHLRSFTSIKTISNFDRIKSQKRKTLANRFPIYLLGRPVLISFVFDVKFKETLKITGSSEEIVKVFSKTSCDPEDLSCIVENKITFLRFGYINDDMHTVVRKSVNINNGSDYLEDISKKLFLYNHRNGYPNNDKVSCALLCGLEFMIDGGTIRTTSPVFDFRPLFDSKFYKEKTRNGKNDTIFCILYYIGDGGELGEIFLAFDRITGKVETLILEDIPDINLKRIANIAEAEEALLEGELDGLNKKLDQYRGSLDALHTNSKNNNLLAVIKEATNVVNDIAKVNARKSKIYEFHNKLSRGEIEIKISSYTEFPSIQHLCEDCGFDMNIFY